MRGAASRLYPTYALNTADLGEIPRSVAAPSFETRARQCVRAPQDEGGNPGLDAWARIRAQVSLRQVGEIDQRLDVGVLLLESGLDLERLHLLQRLDVDPQTRIAIVVVHGQVNLGIDAHHLVVDQELARLARLVEIELDRRFQVLEESPDRGRVLLQELILPDQDDQLLLERHAVLGIEDLAHLHLLFRQRRERLRKLAEIDLAGVERLLHRRERDRRDGDVGLGETMFLERGFQPEMARGVEAVD